MVKPISSKRKLFNANKNQYKENHPDSFNSNTPKTSYNLPAQVNTKTDFEHSKLQNSYSKLNFLDSDNKEKNFLGFYSESSKKCDVENVSSISPRTVMPMSERQQIALVMQLSSTPTNTKAKFTPENSSRTPNAQLIRRSIIKRHKVNERGETPLHVASIKGDTEKVSFLISQVEVDVNATDYAGWTALHEACNRGFLEIAALIIIGGADVNAKGLDDDTPLHDACVNNHYQLVHLLLNCGAKPDSLNRRGKSPIDVCRSPKVLSLLEEAKFGKLEGLDFSTLTHNFETFELRQTLIKQGYILDNTDHYLKMSSRKTPPGKNDDKATPAPSMPSIAQAPSPGNVSTGSSGSRPVSPRVPTRGSRSKTPDKVARFPDKPTEGDDVYEFRCSKDEAKDKDPKNINKDPKTNTRDKINQEKPDSSNLQASKPLNLPVKPQNSIVKPQNLSVKPLNNSPKSLSTPVKLQTLSVKPQSFPVKPLNTPVKTQIPQNKPQSEDKGENQEKRIREEEDDDEAKKKRKKEDKNVLKTNIGKLTSTDRNGKTMNNQRVSLTISKTTSTTVTSNVATVSTSVTTTSTLDTSEEALNEFRKSPDELDETEDAKNENSGAPKVPPLKIVLSGSGSGSMEQELCSNNGKNSNGRHLPYVVNSSSNEEKEMSPLGADLKDSLVKEEPVNSSSNSPTSSNAPISILSSTSSIIVVPSTDQIVSTSNTMIHAVSTNSCSVVSSSTSVSSFTEKGPRITRRSRTKSDTRKKLTKNGPIPRSGSHRSRGWNSNGSEDHQSVVKVEAKIEEPSTATHTDMPPRKRKIKMKEPEPESSSPPIAELPTVHNCYEMFLKIRKQIERRRKLLFPVQPKPPQGFKDYLMNRCSYVLANSANSHMSVPRINAPSTLSQPLKELFEQQEQERYKLRLQQLIEKEKLVLSVEQEILRVHGRAARALANQVLPFSVCTILKDEEIYNVISPEQEEKDRNARSRYNGRLFLSWLQEVDDKWEKIKEAMVLRHHNEAESLHAVQKMDWEWKLKEIGMVEANSRPVIEELHVPMVQVADFDLLPA